MAVGLCMFTKKRARNTVELNNTRRRIYDRRVHCVTRLQFGTNRFIPYDQNEPGKKSDFKLSLTLVIYSCFAVN